MAMHNVIVGNYFIIYLYMVKTLELYYADWCGHCTSYKPEWAAITKVLNKNNIETAQYEHGEHKVKMENEGINSFPTLIYTNENGQKEIILDRSSAGIFDKLNITPSMLGGGCTCSSGNCHIHKGGNNDIIYKNKYLKYKAKYIELKKLNIDFLN